MRPHLPDVHPTSHHCPRVWASERLVGGQWRAEGHWQQPASHHFVEPTRRRTNSECFCLFHSRRNMCVVRSRCLPTQGPMLWGFPFGLCGSIEQCHPLAQRCRLPRHPERLGIVVFHEPVHRGGGPRQPRPIHDHRTRGHGAAVMGRGLAGGLAHVVPAHQQCLRLRAMGARKLNDVLPGV